MAGFTNPLAQDLEHVLAHTQPLWGELNQARIFITGGTGFFGCWLLESLLWACDRLGLNTKVTVLTRRPDAFRQRAPHLAGHSAVTLLRGEMGDFTFPRGQFTHVIHAAGESNMAMAAHPLTALRAAWHGTERVLEFAARCGAESFFYLSSGAVYGLRKGPGKPIAEDAGVAAIPDDATAAYGESKRLGELLCLLHGQERGFAVKIARGFSFLGPYLPLDAHYAAAQFFSASMEGRDLVVRGNEKTVRSYLYGADLAIWLWSIFLQGTPGKPYNVGSNRPVTVFQLAKAIAKLKQPPCRVVVSNLPEKPSMDYYVPDIRRAEKELGLRVTIGLDDAIQRTFHWLAAKESHHQAGGWQ